MPIYLCQPGTGSKEPWRHGVQVYARPFPLGGESESDNDDDGDVDPVATREAERVALASVAGTADASTATAAAAAAASAVATPRGEGVGVSGPANDAAGGAHARGESNDIHVAREGRGRLEAQDDSDLQGGPLLQQHEQQQVQERRLEMQVIRQRRFAAARALDNSTFSNSNSSLEDEINSDHDNDNNNNVNNDNNNNNQSQQELQLRNSQMQQRRQQRQLQNLQGQQHRHHRKLRHQRQRRLPPVRRVRHAEVVLVDQVLVAFRRYWLRLRWPGEHGGFGGFVALGKLEEYLSDGGMAEGKASGKGGTRYDSVGNHDVNFDFGKNSSGETEVVADLETLSKSASTAEKHTANVPLLLCQETNVPYPSSLAMKLLPRYDDGLEMDCGTAAAADDSNMLEESLLGSLKNGEVSVRRFSCFLGLFVSVRRFRLIRNLCHTIIRLSSHFSHHLHFPARVLPHMPRGVARCQLRFGNSHFRRTSKQSGRRPLLSYCRCHASRDRLVGGCGNSGVRRRGLGRSGRGCRDRGIDDSRNIIEFSNRHYFRR